MGNIEKGFNLFFRQTGLVRDAAQRGVASSAAGALTKGAIALALLGTFGIDTTPIVAAAGVTGATLGFACKDVGSNIIASLTLSNHVSLRAGNKVTIGTGISQVSGEIVNWDTRYLYLRGKDKQMLSVPNNTLLTSVVQWDNPPASAFNDLAEDIKAAKKAPEEEAEDNEQTIK